MSPIDDVELVRVALRAASPARSEVGAECLDDGRIASLVEGRSTGADRDAAVEHLAACDRCRGAVSSVARALSGAGVAREVELLRVPTRPRWARYAVPIAAAAAVGTVLLAQMDSRPGLGGLLHREGPSATAPAPIAISPMGPTTTVRVLRWHAVPGADRYRVTVFDDSGSVLYETSVADTLAAIPSDVEIEAERSYYWIVAARTAIDRWDTSALVEFSTSGERR